MSVTDPNPMQLQYAVSEDAPLFLVHDASGTIFNYSLLGDLRRNVFAVYDPKFEREEGWSGGLPEMAREYVALIRKVNPSRPIILGGWSLGGLVSLEMARILDHERHLCGNDDDFAGPIVLGVIMIDTPYTPGWREHEAPLMKWAPNFPSRTPRQICERIVRRMTVYDKLLESWDAPLWPGQGNGQTMVTGGTFRLRQGSIEPPVLLLKAAHRVYFPSSDGIVDVDLFRDEPTLGWSRYPADLVKEVYEIPGHHFDIFDHASRVKNMTKILDQGCRKLSAGLVKNYQDLMYQRLTCNDAGTLQ
ncbi:hypothetical protein CBER1_09968 [Cercospora berteroae]|uniref:Thioesterase domain-containing protein n=1 Tax=Cercospora berteroae TaxID=357750 RepID=A0A2S6C5Y2_9PEZI|nr:hypothetical protein CBER1_09968 [Cercospora berteroae]